MDTTIEVTKEQVIALAKEELKAGLEAFYAPLNVPFIEKQLRDYVKENLQIDLGKMHHVRGMRELRAIGTDYSIFDGGFVLRMHKDYDVRVGLFGVHEEIQKTIDKTKGLTECFTAFFANGDFALLDPPIEHHIVHQPNGGIILHNENGPAILYGDGSCMYSLWDVKVDAKWVETPIEDIDPAEVLAIENVDERAVVIQRIGLDKATTGAKTIDFISKEFHPQGPYTLLDMGHLFDTERALFLQMVCPSTGKVHVEGVPDHITEVREAIAWRAGKAAWCPSIMDGVVNPDGQEAQRQQGDLHMEKLDTLPEGGKLRADRQLQDENIVIRHTIAEGQVWDFDGYQCIVSNKEIHITHPEHNTVNTFNGISRVWNGREVDHVNNIVRDLLD